MSLLSRSIVAATAGIALTGLAACTAQGATGLVNLDPCKIMNAQQLGADGLQAKGTPNNNIGNVPGCTFKSNVKEISFFKSQTQTVDSYQQQQPWQSYTKTTVNGRPAARAEADGALADGNCDMVMDAGGGMVLVDVRDPGASGGQACAEALMYSQQIEPTLPK